MDDSLKDTDWWWIDYLENELDVALEMDLEKLLKHSPEDRDAFENFRLLKQWLRASDPVPASAVEARLPRLRSRIMQAVKKGSAATPTPPLETFDHASR